MGTQQSAPPPSFHIDIVDIEVPISTCKRKQKQILRELLVSFVHLFSMIVFGILLPIYFLLYDMPLEFSVQLPAIDGLDTPPAAHGPGTSFISPAFNVTLHASNRRNTRRCYHNGEALVSYGSFTIAAGRVPAFCMPGKGAGEIRLMASADGVGLPEHLLERMTLDRRVGATLLDVEVRLFRRDDGSERPMWVWCGLRLDGTTKPPNATPCTVLGLQNWFSGTLFV